MSSSARLKAYAAKRRFDETPEPKPQAAAAGAVRRFVMQQHAARRRHFDLRLEHDGVLMSWAVTRGPSLDPKDKRLAVRTEDHPLAYAEFEGVIPAGSYGAGTMMVWDRGKWHPEGDVEAGLAKGELTFALEGARLTGRWTLVRLPPKGRDTRENWLLIKRRDAAAGGPDPVQTWQTSITTGRRLEEIAQGRPGTLNVPAFVPPQLATAHDRAPAGADWLHEIKFDGYRIQAAIGGGVCRLYTRSGHDWTHRFAEIARALAALAANTAVLDGEIVVLDGEGRSDFSALQSRLKKGGEAVLRYMVFDLLALDGKAWAGQPLSARKHALRELMGEGAPLLHFVDHHIGDGPAMHRSACRIGLEGIVSKRADAPYRSGRGDTWRKVKCAGRAEFVIGGWRVSDKPARPFASLLLGSFEDGRLVYRGRVGTGFDSDQMQGLAKRLAQQSIDRSPFADVPAEARRGARFVRPDLVAEIDYAELTRAGVVRHARFLGLREDKTARDVALDRPAAQPAQTQPQTQPQTRPQTQLQTQPQGVHLSHPDKLLWPEAGLTKQRLADYYQAVAARMRPHLKQRPVSLVRCPDGAAADCFYQKHRSAGMDPAIAEVPIPSRKGVVKAHLTLPDEAALVAAAQYAILEIHLWAARHDRIERPDRLVFDLDPGEGVGFDAVRQAAVDLRDLLDAADLQAWPLATGGKGLHLVVPLVRRHDWETVTGFARETARALARADPARFVAVSSLKARPGKIYLDWMRNQRGATAICPYSPRARTGAPVAVPLAWDELAQLPSPAAFGLAEAECRARERDPWTGYGAARQVIRRSASETLKRF